jgi:hypothetical protein
MFSRKMIVFTYFPQEHVFRTHLMSCYETIGNLACYECIMWQVVKAQKLSASDAITCIKEPIHHFKNYWSRTLAKKNWSLIWTTLSLGFQRSRKFSFKRWMVGYFGFNVVCVFQRSLKYGSMDLNMVCVCRRSIEQSRFWRQKYK